MIDNEMMRNGSGYKDETAYKAMTTEPRPGEIWEHRNNGANMLVVARRGKVCSCIRLGSFGSENDIRVVGKTEAYVNPIMLGYVFENLLSCYVKTVPDDQFQEVRRAVVDVFGFEKDKHTGLAENQKEALVESMETMHVKELETKIAEMTLEIDKVAAENIVLEKARRDFEALRMKSSMRIEEIEKKCILLEDAKKESERKISKMEVYRELYDNLLDKLISARGGRGR